MPFLVLRDWDDSDPANCVPQHVEDVLGGPLQAPKLSVRVPVRSIESWLMADSEAFCEYFHTAKVNGAPDELANPKLALVEACRRSKSSGVRRDMVPKAGAKRAVGELYEARIIDFATSHWRIEHALHRSPSLERTVNRLKQLVEDGVW